MRVLHVVSSARRRGAEVFAADLVRLLGQAEVAQRVAVLWSSRGPEVVYEAPVVELAADDADGVSGWFRRVRSLRRQVEQWAPDVVQVHGSDSLKQAVLADPTGRAPLVYRNIGLAAPWATHGLRRALHAGLMRRATKVIAVADIVARQTISTFRIPPDRVVTIANGVDRERLRPVRGRSEVRRSLGIPISARVWLSVGSLSWEKDPLGQVELAAAVMSERPDWFFLLVGDGALRPQVESAISGGGLGARVRLLGSRSDVGDLLGAADALLLASRAGGMEGMPAIVIEAGLAGLPVVAYDVAGVSEVVEDGITGLLAEPGDVDGLARRVHQVLDDPAAGREMGQRALNRCRERFDLRAQLGRYLDLYSEVIRCQRRRDGP